MLLCFYCHSILTLNSLQANEVAQARYEEAQLALQRVSRRMNGFALATQKVKSLVDLGVAVSEVKSVYCPLSHEC